MPSFIVVRYEFCLFILRALCLVRLTILVHSECSKHLLIREALLQSKVKTLSTLYDSNAHCTMVALHTCPLCMRKSGQQVTKEATDRVGIQGYWLSAVIGRGRWFWHTFPEPQVPSHSRIASWCPPTTGTRNTLTWHRRAPAKFWWCPPMKLLVLQDLFSTSVWTWI